ALKWTSFDAVNLIRVLKEFSSRINIIDNTDLISTAFMLGAKGFISFRANLAPRAELQLLELLLRKEYKLFDQECPRFSPWRSVLTAASQLGQTGAGEGTFAKGIFEAIGRPIGPPFPPQRRATKEEIEKIRVAAVSSGFIPLIEIP